jgi:hypothetical protein
MESPISQIYRVIEKGHTQLESGEYQETIQRVFVFLGDYPQNEDIEKIVFDGLDIDNTQIVYIPEFIHDDDTIEIVKAKLNKHMYEEQFLTSELYLFSLHKDSIPLDFMYNAMTKHTISISINDMKQLVANWSPNDFTKNAYNYLINNVKEEYFLEDLIEMFDGYEYTPYYYKPIGLEFTNHYEHLFPGNPYLTLDSVKPFAPTNTNQLYSYDTSLLFTYGPFNHFEYTQNTNFMCKTIYVCNANDVLKKYRTDGLLTDLNQNSIINLYFPLLKDQQIYNLDLLYEKRDELKEAFIDNRLSLLVKQISISDGLYRKYNNTFLTEKNKVKLLEHGITRFHFEIKSEYSKRIPLDNIFKQIHANEQLIMVKYNPDYRKESMYRLYTDKLSDNGRSIPYLKKSDIFKYAKEMITRKGIGFVYKYTWNNESHTLFIELEETGTIVLYGELSIQYNELIYQLPVIFNEFMTPYKGMLSGVGFTVPVLESLYDEKVECKHIDYFWKFQKKNTPQFTQLNGCIYSLFDQVKMMKKSFQWKYKKVSNYVPMDGITSLINELLQQTNDSNIVINELMIQYELNEEKAKEEYSRYLSERELRTGSVKTIEHPGFPTLIEIDEIENAVIVNVQNIHHISYLHALNVYICSLMEVSQNSSHNDHRELLNICTPFKKKEVEEMNKTIITNANVVNIIEEDDDEDDDEDGLLFSDEEEESEEEEEEEESEEEEEEDEESEEEEEEEEEKTIEGGASKMKKKSVSKQSKQKNTGVINKQEIKKNIIKMNTNRRERFDPSLYLKKDDGAFKAYSRSCPSVDGRHPIILTDSEKQEIDKNYRDAYSYALRYGSDPKKKYWYMCPKYWCIKTNTPMTKEQIENGECKDDDGNDNAVELYNKKDQVPGFLKKGTHPDKCVPCCFDEWNKANNIKRREECNTLQDDVDIPSTDDTEVDSSKKAQYETTKIVANILGFEKFPLEEDRSGLLPNSIRMLFNLDYTNKLQKKNTTLLLPNTYALLRYGVELSSNQSFLACMASIHQFITNVDTKLTLQQFRQQISDNIQKDDFIKYQNGNLISAFRVDNDDAKDEAKSGEDSYKKTVEKSLQNFKQYISDEDSFIDHTYLWEFFTKKKDASERHHLFPNGMNLVIFELKHYDITDNVDIICPSSTTDTLFDASKPTFFVIKQGNYYEPIYLQEHKNKKNIIKQSHFFLNEQATFDETLQKEVQNVILLLEEIQAQEDNICRSLPSIKEYKYKNNLYAATLASKLATTDYGTIKKQITNFQGKTIALLINKNDDGNSYYLPCAPSYQLPDIEVLFIESLDEQYIHSYEITMEYLNDLKRADPTILCKPMLKMVQENMVIGIIVETNQVILVTPEGTDSVEDKEGSQPLEIYTSLNVKQQTDFVEVETQSSIHNHEQTKETIISKMQLEDFFYKSFRNICRNKLADYKHINVLKSIKHHINNPNLYYHLKLSYVTKLLQDLLTPFVDFTLELDENSYKMLSETQKLHCNENTTDQAYCTMDNDIVKLLIPNKNLVNGEQGEFPNNETFYYTKLADELIRNKRIRMYMIHPREYSFNDVVDYEINKDEMFLLQSNMNKEYFDSLVPIHENPNKYVKNTQYDSVQPNMIQVPRKEPVEFFKVNGKRRANVEL